MAPSQCVRVLVLDAHAGVRGAIATFVEATEDMELVGKASNKAEAVRLCASARPDVALVGIALEGSNGFQAIAAIHRRWPEIRIVAMGGLQEERRMQAALAAGAVGYVLKDVSADELAAAIRRAYATQNGAGPAALVEVPG